MNKVPHTSDIITGVVLVCTGVYVVGNGTGSYWWNVAVGILMILIGILGLRQIWIAHHKSKD